MTYQKVQIAGTFKKIETISKETAEQILTNNLSEEEFLGVKSILSCDKFRIVEYNGVKTLLGVERYTIKKEFNEDFFVIQKKIKKSEDETITETLDIASREAIVL